MEAYPAGASADMVAAINLYTNFHSQILRPGGKLIGEWYAPEHVEKAYGTGGPPVAEMCELTAADFSAQSRACMRKRNHPKRLCRCV